MAEAAEKAKSRLLVGQSDTGAPVPFSISRGLSRSRMDFNPSGSEEDVGSKYVSTDFFFLSIFSLLNYLIEQFIYFLELIDHSLNDHQLHLVAL